MDTITKSVDIVHDDDEWIVVDYTNDTPTPTTTTTTTTTTDNYQTIDICHTLDIISSRIAYADPWFPFGGTIIIFWQSTYCGSEEQQQSTQIDCYHYHIPSFQMLTTIF